MCKLDIQLPLLNPVTIAATAFRLQVETASQCVAEAEHALIVLPESLLSWRPR